MSAPSKLYWVTSDSCTLPLYTSATEVFRHPANDVPQLLWPDGTVCWLVNMYLLSGYMKGRSRKNKGGTLLTWAKNLSHLVRWCALNSVDFVDLTDSHFKMFVNTLLLEKDSERPSEKRRSDQQVSTICSTVLNFLAFVDERFPSLNLLGPNGRVHAEKKRIEVNNGGRSIIRVVWMHDHVPRKLRARRRQPISTTAVNRLYEAVATMNASAFVTRRRFILLRVMDVTGGRRIEAAYLKVADIEEAFKTGELKVFNAKRRDGKKHRYVPVGQADLKELQSFVKHYRARVIRAAGVVDHGFLFVAERTGEPLSIDTLGTEMYLMRKAAGIDDEEACLHAFRHRYITNIFRDLIQAHQLKNESDFRRMLLSAEDLKMKVKEWSGHSSIHTLERYIHLAFEAETDFQGVLDVVKAKRIVESLQVMLKNYSSEFNAAKPSRSSYYSLAEVVDEAAAELRALLKADVQNV